MALQNRTLASSAVGNDESNRNDIANNPVAGKYYMGNGTGSMLAFSNNTVDLTTNLISDPNTSLIEFDVNGANVTTDMKSVLKRPPGRQAFTQVVRSGGVIIAPGQIRNSQIRWKRKLSVNTFVRIIFDALKETSATKLRLNLGKFEFFGFERKVSTGVDEPSISIGYEINQVFRCLLTEKSVATNTYVIVQ